MIALFVPPVVATAADVAEVIARVARDAEKPCLPVVMSADGAPPGAFAYPESAARALGLAARRASWLRRPAGVVPTLEGVDRAAASSLIAEALALTDDLWLEPREARELLTAYGLPLVEERYAATPQAASLAATELRVPGRRQVRGGGRAQDGVGRRSRPPPRRRERRARSRADRWPRRCPVVHHRGRRAPAGAIEDPVFGPLVSFGPAGVSPSDRLTCSRWRRSPTSTPISWSRVGSRQLVAGWRGGSSPLTAPPSPTRRIASQGSSSSIPRWPSSTRPRSSPGLSAASQSTHASGCGDRVRPALSRPGERGLLPPVPAHALFGVEVEIGLTR